VERLKDNLEMEDTVLYLKNMSEDLKSLDEQYWTNWEGCNMESQKSEAKPQNNIRQQAPPIPARSTSWYLSSILTWNIMDDNSIYCGFTAP